VAVDVLSVEGMLDAIKEEFGSLEL
jgi:hypothetical protein